MNLPAQAGLLAAIPTRARYLRFQLRAPVEAARPVLRTLATSINGLDTVAGLGTSLVSALGGQVPGLHELHAPEGALVPLPVSPAALWLWLRDESGDPGLLLHRGRQFEQLLAPAFDPDGQIDAFCHDGGRDLTGYIDGTENPEGDAALQAALLQGHGAGLDGSSLVAVQTWEHDLGRFDSMPHHVQDHVIGRRRGDNAELDDAPPSAHVQRTAQESFSPEAFLLRRSMPWVCGARCGLQFVAFGASLTAFEAQLARMSGCEDGLLDGLYSFTRPLDGASYWCPPLRDGHLDLSHLGL